MAFPIFDKVGGTEAALALIAAAGGGHPTKGVQDKWRLKRELPYKVEAWLMDECQKRGIAWTYPRDFEWVDEVKS